jgi:transposase
MLGIVYKGVAFPLLFSMLPKRGNSNSQERIDLISRFGHLFGFDIIEAIVADREFVGDKWFEYLNKNQIRYYIRIRKNFKVFLLHQNKEIKAFRLFDKFKVNEFTFHPNPVRVSGQLCYISGAKLDIKNNKQEYLIIVSFEKPENAQELYKQRWQIEMTFKAMKSSGFDIEKTHLQDIERLEKLVLLVMIAFVWAYKVGIYLHEKKPILIKKHGRKAKSIFKHGLSYLAKVFLNNQYQNEIEIFKFLSCT